MTATAASVSRYVVEERFEGTPRGERALAIDERLKRRVVLWTAGGEATEALIALGQRAAAFSHPVFLPVLDAVIETGRATVVLQAPSCPALTIDAISSLEKVGGAKRVVLEVARGLDDAGRHGLRARVLPLTYLYCCPEGIRLDSVGVLSLPGEEAGDEVGLLLGLAEELAENDDALAELVRRWRKRATARRSLPRFIEELEAMTPDAAGYPPLRGAGADDDDVTMVLPAVPELQHARVYAAPIPTEPARRGVPMAVLIAIVAVVAGAVLALGSGFGVRSTVQGGEQAAAAPVPGNAATMKLIAQRDTQIRVWVDEQLKADGVLKQGGGEFFEGSRRVHVWTNGGRNLQIEVNGYPLGTVSEAVGQPQWNTVDWAWPAGWKPPGR